VLIMGLLIYFGLIVGFFIIALIIEFVQRVSKDVRFKKILRNNKDWLEEIDFEKYNENIHTYKDYLINNALTNLTLPKPKLDNKNFSKNYFLSFLYKKYKYSSELLRDVLFR